MRINFRRKVQGKPGGIAETDFKAAAAHRKPLPDTAEHLDRLSEKERRLRIACREMPYREKNNQHKRLPDEQVFIVGFDGVPHD